MSNEKEKVDRFSELMFGSSLRKKDSEEEIIEKKDTAPLEQSSSDDSNYFQIMSQLDDIMGSWENLKPMMKELSPIINYFKKKK